MISVTPGETVLTKEHAFDPQKTFTCGQCFRFQPKAEGFFGIAGGREIFVSGSRNETRLLCPAEDFAAFWRTYFDIDRPYEPYRAQIAGDPFLKAAAEFGDGIRILRQEPFETLCTFILSQCNNIPRITALVERLARHFGRPTPSGYAFPEPETLALLSPEDLAPVRAGYRAPYLLAAARAVAEGRLDLSALSDPSLPLNEARARLTALPGVGRKVADCVLLFGQGRWDAFPVDVWMRRALAQYYPAGFQPENYPAAAGLYQQYMFFTSGTSATPAPPPEEHV